ncbi:TetR/AcrR family transcriptional regulator [Serinicoccus kebangsaanensis]|uniref:TetR/AcrR family transcriptional regulator n=1 Tax=Serinicoccus kebangsaanensis TaxID=2602069 RepID=UPI00178C3F90|nr:WHG domain-containing protein [Serinicoccus kebangsaanensis]
MVSRAEARERTTARILEAARVQIAESGASALSTRAVAREVGLVSSALFRYFPTRDALLTALIAESYRRLGDTLDAVPRHRSPARRWTATALALRAWAREHPHEFQLIYGTPVPGYAAPPDTVPLAAAVARPFLEAGAREPVAGFEKVAAQMSELREVFDVDPAGGAAVLAELAALLGAITLELGGHFVGTADPADELYAALVARQVRTLGLR